MPDYDLIIIGGGIIGGSVLYHLGQLGYKGQVLVLEREDALSKGSTALSAGGFRNIWTTPINMRLTSYSIRKLASFREELNWPIGFDQRGYLFCQYEENFESARTFGREWEKNGVRIEFLDAREVEKKVPGLVAGIDHIDPDVNEVLQMKPIAGGVFGPDCGSFDPSAAAQGYFERGLEAFNGRAELRLRTPVKSLHLTGGVYPGVGLEDGTLLETDKLLISAGAGCRRPARRVRGTRLPRGSRPCRPAPPPPPALFGRPPPPPKPSSSARRGSNMYPVGFVLLALGRPLATPPLYMPAWRSTTA